MWLFQTTAQYSRMSQFIMIEPSPFNPFAIGAFSYAIPSILLKAAKCAGTTEIIKRYLDWLK